VVISAACHVVPSNTGNMSVVEEQDRDGDGLYGVDSTYTGHNGKSYECEESQEFLNAAATGLLKWGEVNMQRHTGGSGVDEATGHETGHLAFGTEEQDVKEPRVGRWYAGVTSLSRCR